MSIVTLRKQGNSVGVTFPAETRIRMGFEVGQDLTLQGATLNLGSSITPVGRDAYR